MGRRKKPNCDHVECEIQHQGRCLRAAPISTSIAALRAARAASYLTQDEAARLVHMSDGRVWRRWEAGSRPISETAVQLFALLTDQPYPLAEPEAVAPG